jgi:hypothetical protein
MKPRLPVMDDVQRRGLINGAIAAALTFVVGSTVLLATGSRGGLELPTATATTTSPTPPACEPSFEIVESADVPEATTTLLGVAAVTATQAWAVGGIGEPDAPTDVAIQRWDGDEWTIEDAPSPGGFINELRAVDASGPNDVWAVGRTSSGFGDEPLVLHHDGEAWSEFDLPDEVDGVLNDVAAISPTDVWVVGFVGDPAASLERALVLHWDGVAWAEVEVRRAIGGGKAALTGIGWVSPTDIWVVGYHHFRPLVLRFDGAAWSRSETEIRGDLFAVEPFATGEVWGIGTPIQRFDGEAWTEANVVRSDGLELVDGAAVGGRDVWAVGTRSNEDDPATRIAVYRYSGRRWLPVDGPPVGGSDALTAVDALPDGTVLAVGTKDFEVGRRTLAVMGSTCPAPPA